MIWTASFSTSVSRTSILLSAATTARAASPSRSTSARIEAAMADSASPPISAMLARSRLRSSSKALSVWPVVAMFVRSSAVAAGDVILGSLDPRIGEDLRRLAIFDELAEVEESGALRDPRRLLHVVGDD